MTALAWFLALLLSSSACAGPRSPSPEASPPTGAAPTPESPMWMQSVRSATIGKKQLDAIVARITALPDADQQRLHSALNELDRQAGDVDGLDNARRSAESKLTDLLVPHESSGLPAVAAAYRDAAVAVLQARARMVGEGIAASGEPAAARRLIAVCDERRLGDRAYDLKVEAAIGLGDLAPEALRAE